MKDIAKFSGVGYTTLKVLWKDFTRRKIVVQTRLVGRAKMYRLNKENPVVAKFIEYYWTVISNEIGVKEEKRNLSTESYGRTNLGTASDKNV